jgi:hypothetical protein
MYSKQKNSKKGDAKGSSDVATLLFNPTNKIMLSPIVKKGKDLTETEIQQLYRLHLYYQVDPSTEAAHQIILGRHVDRMDVTFYLYKHQEEMVAYHAVTWFKRQTPFSKKPLPVLHANLSFKDPTADHLVKNYVKRTNKMLVRQHLGPFWFLRPFVITFNTVSVKGIERIRHIMKNYYPNGATPPVAVYDFAKKHLQEDLKIDPSKLSSELVLRTPNTPLIDITDVWQKQYASTSPSLNNFFVEQGIVKKETQATGTRYALQSDNFALFVGHYSPWALLRSGVRNTLSRG